MGVAKQSIGLPIQQGEVGKIRRAPGPKQILRIGHAPTGARYPLPQFAVRYISSYWAVAAAGLARAARALQLDGPRTQACGLPAGAVGVDATGAGADGARQRGARGWRRIPLPAQPATVPRSSSWPMCWAAIRRGERYDARVMLCPTARTEQASCHRPGAHLPINSLNRSVPGELGCARSDVACVKCSKVARSGVLVDLVHSID